MTVSTPDMDYGQGERPMTIHVEDPNFKWDASDLDHHVDLNIFEKKIHTDHIALPPFWLSDPLKGVAEDLDKGLGHWKTSLNGYLVAYENIEYDGNQVGGMYVDQPWLHVDVRATFYTYKPSVGQILKGTIKRVAAKAALCTVFNCFSVSVFPSRPDELNNWQVGAQIEFKVTTVQNRRKGPVIRATSCGTEVTFAAREFKSSNTPKKPKNTILKFSDDDDAEIEVDGFTGLPIVSTPHKKSGIVIDEADSTKKRKRRRLVEEAEEVYISQFPPEPGALTTYVAEDVYLESLKKKKSKKRKTEGDEFIDPPVTLAHESEELDEPVKKKKKKHKKDKSEIHGFDCDVIADVEISQEDVSVKKKKKKHKKDKSEKHEFDCEVVVKEEEETLQETEVPIMKKKKHKKDTYL